MWKDHHYLIDTHTAVAFHVLDQYRAETGDETPTVVDESTIGLNSVSTMDEIIPQIHEDIPETEFGDIESELSLESVIEDEENEDDDEDDEE